MAGQIYEMEVFKVGRHTDAQGRTQDWTADKVRQIEALYNTQRPDARHEAPIVKGHPADNTPAEGWVQRMRFDAASGKLFASYTISNPEFLDELRRGAFKKRSLSLYPDGRLRHIGFVTIPAVKGMDDPSFSAEDRDCSFFYSDFQDPLTQDTTYMEETLTKILEALTAQGKTLESLVAKLDAKPPAEDAGKSDAGKSDAGDGGGGGAPAFSEQLTAELKELREFKATAAAENAQLRREKADAEYNEFLAGLVTARKITPAQVPGHLVTMRVLAGSADFADAEKTVSVLDAFKASLTSAPAILDEQLFREMATGGAAGAGVDPALKLADDIVAARRK